MGTDLDMLDVVHVVDKYDSQKYVSLAACVHHTGSAAALRLLMPTSQRDTFHVVQGHSDVLSVTGIFVFQLQDGFIQNKDSSLVGAIGNRPQELSATCSHT